MKNKAFVHILPLIGLTALVFSCQSPLLDPTTQTGLSESVSVTAAPRTFSGQNGLIMQYFHWYSAGGGVLWNNLAADATNLDNLGVTAVWIPPAYKGGGALDVGYGVYDLYDLGEFNQKGTVATKYGTKAQLIGAVDALHAKGIQVYGDVVINHRMGADATEQSWAVRVAGDNRNTEWGGDHNIYSWTNFNFPGRGNTYSSFKWHWYHFDGVDYAENIDDAGWSDTNIWKFRGAGKAWDWEVDTEKGNYDYLMGADLDFDHPEVRDEMITWAKWYMDTAKLDGLRIDAVKHIKYDYWPTFLDAVRAYKGSNFFAVGEFVDMTGDVGKLNNFITKSGGRMSLFDFEEQKRFYDASRSGGSYDMRYFFDSTLMKDNPTFAVTFVDNHDTQPLQALERPVDWWFKPIAYASILTRSQGYPEVFWPDLYGASYSDVKNGTTYNITLAPVPKLDKMMQARKWYAYGAQHDYIDHWDVIGWTREGDAAHPGSGLAALVSDGPAGSKSMYVGTQFAGRVFYDYTGNRADTVTIDASGNGNFQVNGGSVSIWVPQTVTTIKATYNVGSGNNLTIRGGASPLSWTTGAAMTWTTGNVWTYTTTAIPIGTAFEYKVLINDVMWSDGANYATTAGTSIGITPTFNGNFYDTMDSIGTNWAVTGGTSTYKWHQGTLSGSGVAEAYAASTESQLTMKTAVNKQGTVTLAFKYSVTGLDSGEYLAVDVLKGTTWTQVATFTGTKAATNAAYNISAYGSSAMKLRFRAKMSDTTEKATVDNVSISVK